MGCIGSRTVGGYRGGAGAGGGRTRRGPVLRPLPHQSPRPSGSLSPHRPAPPRSLTFPLCPRGPCLPLSSPFSPRASGPRIPLDSVLSVSLRLPSIALAQARSLSIISPPTFSLLRRPPRLSRSHTLHLQAIGLDSAFPSASSPPPSISGAAPVLRTPSLSLSPESLSHAPAPAPPPSGLGVLPPSLSLSVAFFGRFCLPRFALFTCIFPPGRGRGEPGASGRGMGSTAGGNGAGLGWGGRAGDAVGRRGVRGPERGREPAPRRVGLAERGNPGTWLHLSTGAGGAGPALYLPLTGERKRGASEFFSPQHLPCYPVPSPAPRTPTPLSQLSRLIQPSPKTPNFSHSDSQFLPPTCPSDLRLRE